MKIGKTVYQNHIAYWLQFGKTRFGFFIKPFPLCWLNMNAVEIKDAGWAVSLGPFQICHYRWAK